MTALLWLTFSILLPLIYTFDPSISNGTCYYGPGQEAASNFIPCGNAAGGVQSCCQARDICLSSNACFNGQYYVTYLAGCTDSNYSDPACPDKGDFASQQWVGLVRCHVSNGTGEQWGPCAEPIQPKINTANDQCTCDASSSTAVFTDAAVLTNIASLPVSIGNDIAWYSGFTPSTTIAESTSSSKGTTATATKQTSQTTASPGSSASTSTLTSSTAIPDSTEPHSFSTATKAGIGIGAAVGALALGALFSWFVWYRRKNRSVPPIKDQIRPSSLSPWDFHGGDFSDKSNQHKSWGARSELPTDANETTTTKTNLGENTIRTNVNTPTTPYHPYQHSPSAEASEMEASPTASTSGLTSSKLAYERGPIYEMPA